MSLHRCHDQNFSYRHLAMRGVAALHMSTSSCHYESQAQKNKSKGVEYGAAVVHSERCADARARDGHANFLIGDTVALCAHTGASGRPISEVMVFLHKLVLCDA